MKKSISFIIVVCLSSILMFSSFADAAGVSAPIYRFSDRPITTTVSSSHFGRSAVSVIEFSTDIYVFFSEAFYLNGVLETQYDFNITNLPISDSSDPSTIRTGYVGRYEVYFEPNNALGMNSGLRNFVYSNGQDIRSKNVTGTIRTVFDNFQQTQYDYIYLGRLTLQLDIDEYFLSNTSLTNIDILSIYTTCSINIYPSSSVGYSLLEYNVTPVNAGLVGIIRQAIDNSNDIEQIKYYTDLLEEYMILFPQYSKDVVYYLQEFYGYLSEAESGATEAADAADHAASQAAAIAAVPRPNAGAIINEGVNRIDTDISSGFGVLGAILNQQWYIWILMIVISLAFVSYLMYGKGV